MAHEEPGEPGRGNNLDADGDRVMVIPYALRGCSWWLMLDGTREERDNVTVTRTRQGHDDHVHENAINPMGEYNLALDGSK
jgi:hypothetical protein